MTREEEEKLYEDLQAMWAHSCDEEREDDLLANIIEDDEDYIDEYFDPDEFE